MAKRVRRANHFALALPSDNGAGEVSGGGAVDPLPPAPGWSVLLSEEVSVVSISCSVLLLFLLTCVAVLLREDAIKSIHAIVNTLARQDAALDRKRRAVQVLRGLVGRKQRKSAEMEAKAKNKMAALFQKSGQARESERLQDSSELVAIEPNQPIKILFIKLVEEARTGESGEGENGDWRTMSLSQNACFVCTIFYSTTMLAQSTKTETRNRKPVSSYCKQKTFVA